MLEAKHPHDANKPLIPPGTEAHLLMIYKSNYTRWMSRVEYFKKEGWGAKLPAKKKKVNGVKEPDPLHDALFTREDSGRATYGSITDEGLDYYEEARKEIKEARKLRGKKMKKVDKKWLELHRENNKDKVIGKKRGREAGDGGDDEPKRTKICESDGELGGSDDEDDGDDGGESGGDNGVGKGKKSGGNDHDSEATEGEAEAPAKRIVEV